MINKLKLLIFYQYFLKIISLQENEEELKLRKLQDMAKAELAAAIASEKAAQIEKMAEANLHVSNLAQVIVLSGLKTPHIFKKVEMCLLRKMTKKKNV